jgi:hypothetical protein
MTISEPMPVDLNDADNEDASVKTRPVCPTSIDTQHRYGVKSSSRVRVLTVILAELAGYGRSGVLIGVE